MNELLDLLNILCTRLDTWLIRQPKAVQLSAAEEFGPEYAGLHLMLTRLNAERVTKLPKVEEANDYSKA